MPDLFFAIAGMVAVAAVIISFVVVLNRSSRLLPEEVGRRALFTERAGGRFGDVNFTVPFVRVAVYDTFLVLAAYKTILLRAEDLVSFGMERHLFSHGVRIIHRKADCPDPLIVWSLSPHRLLPALRVMQERSHKV
jgi:hypothetical protein